VSEFREDEAVVEGTEEFLPPAPADVDEQVDTDEMTGEVVEPAPRVEEAEAAAAKTDGIDYEALVAERTADLQRVHAEYANYKKRVDRDRGLAKQSGIEAVILDLMPVLDAIQLAQQHDDLAEGSKMIVDEFVKITTKHGLVTFGAVGEPFDPVKHEALMQVPLDEPVEVVTVSQVIQPGYELKGRVIRPARVAVANP
jgi:molecular chaperone GrpE